MKIIKWIKILFYNLVVTLVLFLLVDVSYTFLSNFKGIISAQLQRIVRHPDLHHTLKEHYIDTENRICTDRNGFKVDCENKDRTLLSYDVIFVGDSFTEGIALPYKDTFVGMYDLAHPSLRVANLGVISYSPTRYLQKVSNFLNESFKTKHVVVFPDISDMRDEAIIHRYESFKMPESYLFIHKNFVLTGQIIEYTISGGLLPMCPFFHVDGFFCAPRKRDRGRDWVDNPNAKGFEPLGVSKAIERSLSKMEQLYNLLDRQGIKLSIGVYPWIENLRDYDENTTQVQIWKKFCEQRCFAFINAYPDFFEIERTQGVEKLENDYTLPDDSKHFNKNGNKVVFEVLNREFKVD